MRQGLFAVLLILAAFAGGGLVNGPGLDWIRQQLATSNQTSAEPPEADLALIEYAEAVPNSDQDEPEPASEAPERSSGQDRPSSPLPVAEDSPFSSRPSAHQRGSNATRAVEEPSPPSVPAPRGGSIAASPDRTDSVEPNTPPSSSPDIPKAPASLFDVARSKLRDRPVIQVSEKSGSDPSPAKPDPTSASAAEPWADSPDSAAPASAALPKAERPASSDRDSQVRRAGGAETESAASDLSNWEGVERRMTELGVGRYWVEGDFGGPVIFRCVVPVVGDRAVSQHFEAEGDDLLSASRDALKRIALWKATEAAP